MSTLSTVETAGAPPMRGLRHIALRVRDLAKAEQFYVGILGYIVEWRPSPGEVYLTRGDDNLALHATAPAEPTSLRETALDHFGLVVDRVEHIHEWVAYLQAHGVTLDTPARTHRDGATSFYVRDPEGNRIQFLHHPPLSSHRS